MSFFNTWAKTIQDKVLLWLHGRRLGIFGDGQNTTSGQPINNASLVLDGVTIGSTRTGAAPLMVVASGTASVGAVTTAGTLVGDNVLLVLDMNAAPFVDVTADFESTISVAGQTQQTVALGGTHSCLFFISPQAAA